MIPPVERHVIDTPDDLERVPEFVSRRSLDQQRADLAETWRQHAMHPGDLKVFPPAPAAKEFAPPGAWPWSWGLIGLGGFAFGYLVAWCVA
jgi:hypothetical protein